MQQHSTSCEKRWVGLYSTLKIKEKLFIWENTEIIGKLGIVALKYANDIKNDINLWHWWRSFLFLQTVFKTVSDQVFLKPRRGSAGKYFPGFWESHVKGFGRFVNAARYLNGEGLWKVSVHLKETSFNLEYYTRSIFNAKISRKVT